MKRIAMAMAVLAAGLAASPAMAQDGHVAIGNADYVVVPPRGYCAEGIANDQYMATQRKLGMSEIEMVLMRCDAPAGGTLDFFSLRVNRGGPDLGRASFLAYMKQTMPAAKALDTLTPKSKLGDLQQRLSTLFGAEAGIEAGVKPIDVDDVCAYVGGVVTVQVKEKSVVGMVVGCATVIGGKVVQLNRTLPGSDISQARTSMAELKTLAQSIAAKQ